MTIHRIKIKNYCEKSSHSPGATFISVEFAGVEEIVVSVGIVGVVVVFIGVLADPVVVLTVGIFVPLDPRFVQEVDVFSPETAGAIGVGI